MYRKKMTLGKDPVLLYNHQCCDMTSLERKRYINKTDVNKPMDGLPRPPNKQQCSSECINEDPKGNNRIPMDLHV